MSSPAITEGNNGVAALVGVGVFFGRDAAQAGKLAEVLSKRPWHNVAYFPGSFEVLAAAIGYK